MDTELEKTEQNVEDSVTVRGGESEGGIRVTAKNAPAVQAAALLAISHHMRELLCFFGGQSLPEVMAAKSKSETTSAIITAAIKDLGFDAARFETYETEIPHLVDKIFDKIAERESGKANGEMKGPDVNAEGDYLKWKEEQK